MDSYYHRCKYFTMERTDYVDGISYLFYYADRDPDWGKSFCQMKNGEIIYGHDWCFSIKDHIVNLCKMLKTNKTYDLHEYFQGPLRDASISKLIG